ncbi:MAG: TonB family protein [Myxococcales bacterium]|nr:TonB family protein [Polyangiaceae bacterium]MDW8247704.1 TonB family protein [Myxococcales bacterium]
MTVVCPSRRAAGALLAALALGSSLTWAQQDTPPSVLEGPPPIYPEQAPLSGKPQRVELRLEIDETGKLQGVEVVGSAGEVFDRAALQTVQRWTFRAATRDGRPIRSRVKVALVFEPPSLPPPALRPSEAARSQEQGSLPLEDPSLSPRQTPPSTGEASLGEVVVQAQGRMPSRGAGDVEVYLGKLRSVPRQDAASLLRLAPGIFLTNTGGAGHPYQIYLRGFDAREGQDLEFKVEGVPINEVGNVHGNGLVDTHYLLPEVVRSLRVIEGPFAPQQGNFAVAGSALYDLGLEQRGLAASVTAGSFGSRRALLLWGPSWGGPKTFGAVEAFSMEGFGQNRSARRMTAMASHEGPLGSSGSWRILATSYATHYDQAGVLRVDDMKAGRIDFYGTYDPQQGGDSTRHGLLFRIEQSKQGFSWTQFGALTLRDFRLRQNFTGFLADPQRSWQSDHPQRGDLIDQRSRILTLQALGSGRKTWTTLSRKHSLELGYSARVDDVDSLQQRNRAGTNIPYRRDLDLASFLTNLGLYVDAEMRPLPKVLLRGGVRSDLFHYRVHNRCALTVQSGFGGDPPDTECFQRDRTGYRSVDQTASTAADTLQPRVALLVGPFSGFSFSLARGTGVRSLDPQYIHQGLDTPFAVATATEGGASYEGELAGGNLSVRSIFFRTFVDRDLFFNQTEGRNTLAEGTSRTGWAGTTRWITEYLDIAANLTLVRAIFEDTKLLIPYAPNVVGRLDAVLAGSLARLGSKPLRGTLGAGASYVGPRPLPFDERSQDIFLLDAAATLRWSWVQLGVTSTNLLDRRYRLSEFNYTSSFRTAGFLPTQVAARHFSAGEPRAVYGTLTLFLDDSP